MDGAIPSHPLVDVGSRGLGPEGSVGASHGGVGPDTGTTGPSPAAIGRANARRESRTRQLGPAAASHFADRFATPPTDRDSPGKAQSGEKRRGGATRPSAQAGDATSSAPRPTKKSPTVTVSSWDRPSRGNQGASAAEPEGGRASVGSVLLGTVGGTVGLIGSSSGSSSGTGGGKLGLSMLGSGVSGGMGMFMA